MSMVRRMSETAESTCICEVMVCVCVCRCMRSYLLCDGRGTCYCVNKTTSYSKRQKRTRMLIGGFNVM